MSPQNPFIPNGRGTLVITNKLEQNLNIFISLRKLQLASTKMPLVAPNFRIALAYMTVLLTEFQQ